MQNNNNNRNSIFTSVVAVVRKGLVPTTHAGQVLREARTSSPSVASWGGCSGWREGRKNGIDRQQHIVLVRNVLLPYFDYFIQTLIIGGSVVLENKGAVDAKKI